MRWIVGIDLEGRSEGALRMAAWLRTHRRPEAEQDFVGIHVLDERLRLSFPPESIEKLAPLVNDMVAGVLGRAGAASPFSDVDTVWAHSAERGLADAVQIGGATGLLVGRIAPREGRAIERLGRVARRLLRHLPAAVLVVPPDLRRTEVGAGPILLATDLGAASVPAAALARELATAVERPLVVLHVDDTLYTAPALAPEAIVPILRMPRRTVADVQEWARAHDLGDVEARLVEGDVPTKILDMAHELDAPIIACGSRRLGLTDRFFTSSVGTDLARSADRAVLVVPPA